MSMPDIERQRLHHWHLLDRQQQQDAIRRLSAQGLSDGIIATATRLTREEVRRVIGQGPEPEAA